jgi:ribosome-associated translation inhibitor RaiA/cold shock CspA family protein
LRAPVEPAQRASHAPFEHANTMTIAVHITFHGLPRSMAAERLAREKAAQLLRWCPDILACRVGIGLEHKHQRQGRAHGVRIDLTRPDQELVVDRAEHEDLFVALREAFDSIARKLQQATHTQRGEVKQHEPELAGEIVRLADGFGFIRSAGGDEYYFGRDNLHGATFEQLRTGQAVHFLGDGGGTETPRALRVTLARGAGP